ncbi:hypothetical protein B0H19DRAFT_945517 [Mycena capillaripes]|nr:hypothetical protein B0H19DRAFT_945517 [Mycena capillaripes]
MRPFNKSKPCGLTLRTRISAHSQLLYNRFGLKAEEFVAGFHDAYPNPQSRASRNAFRLWLGQH